MSARFAFTERTPSAELLERASSIRRNDCSVGRVHSTGAWTDAETREQLGASLGPLSAALRSGFEWYQCRGAFFHNDAHYDATLFGVWCIVGAPAELVFARAGVRLNAAPGSIAIFDPFEVHGVLAPGCTAYSPEDYRHADASVFVGFELDLTPAVAAAFGIEKEASGAALSSHTRVCAVSGQIS